MSDLPGSLPHVDSVLSQFRGDHCPSALAQPAIPARGLGFRKVLAEHPVSLLPGTAK